MTWDNLIILLSIVIGSGGLGAVVHALAAKKKNKVDAAETAVKTIIEIEKLSMTRYQETYDKLEKAELLIAQVKHELTKEKEYIAILQHFIENNGFDVPERPH